jgi:hypothetical protein
MKLPWHTAMQRLNMTIDREFNLRGFEFQADAIIIAAMKRWRIRPVGTYENFLRQAYWDESMKTYGFVVDLSRDLETPLKYEEVMRTDPYALSVWYGPGDYSKHFEGKYGIGTHVVMGDECTTCHSVERDGRGKCVVCAREAHQHQQEAYRLAHPEIERARSAKQKDREKKLKAQRIAAEKEAVKKRKAREVRHLEVAVRKAALEAVARGAVLARAAAKQEARIQAARERESLRRERLHKKVENKFEGKPCGTCGTTTRYINDHQCVACTVSYQPGRATREKQATAPVNSPGGVSGPINRR